MPPNPSRFRYGLLLSTGFWVFGILSGWAEPLERYAPSIEIQVHYLVLKEGSEKISQAVNKPEDSDLEGILQELEAVSAVEFLSGPSVTASNGIPTKVQLLRTVDYPAKLSPAANGTLQVSETAQREVGVVLEVTPELSRGKILLSGTYALTEVAGTLQLEPGIETSLFVQREIPFAVGVKSGETRILQIQAPADVETPSKQFLLISAHVAAGL